MWPPVRSSGDPPSALRTSSHDSIRDAVNHIIRESRQHAHRERTSFLPSSAPGGRGGCVDIAISTFVISDAEVGHTLVDIVDGDPDLVEGTPE